MCDFVAFCAQRKEKLPNKTFKKHRLGYRRDPNPLPHKGRFIQCCRTPDFNGKGGDQCRLGGIIAVPLILRMTLD